MLDPRRTFRHDPAVRLPTRALGVYLALSTGCAAPTAKRVFSPRAKDPVVVAHRGASAYAPENTLAAYRAALERGADVAECDVFMSRDGEVVVMHDETLERTTNGSGRIDAQDWAALRSLDAGSWFSPEFAGEPIPRLPELLDLIGGKMLLLIEIKQGEGIVDAIAAELSERPRRQSRRVAIISFDPEMIAEAERKLPKVPQMLLVWTDRGQAVAAQEAVAQALEIDAEALGVPYWGATRALVEASVEAGLELFVYTVNEPGDVQRVLSLGVDGIISDYPDRTAELIRP